MDTGLQIYFIVTGIIFGGLGGWLLFKYVKVRLDKSAEKYLEDDAE